jgi:hypothetical protein
MLTPYSNIISVTTLSNLLLDTYSGAAAAYSLRQLSSTYSGSAIRVRRQSDNTEQDIGFLDNELDTSALTTFCSGTNGFVTTWYDQSGNGYDATQIIAIEQLQIVSIGSIVVENLKPALESNGVSTELNTNINISGDFSIFGVYKNTKNSSFMLSQPEFGRRSNSQYRLNASGISINGGVHSNNQILLSAIVTDANGKIYANDIQQATAVGIHTSSIITRISTNSILGNIQEIIVYDTSQDSNQVEIRNLINSYYGIY